MISIRISTTNNSPISRQIPEDLKDKYLFFINKDVPEADYWFILDDVRGIESCNCPPENIYLTIGEPESIRKYKYLFLKQFNTILTCQTSLKHKNIQNTFPLLPWFVGLSFNPITSDLDIEEMSIADILASPKTVRVNKLAIIISNKSYSEGQKKRLDFIMKLKEDLKEDLHVFGHGFNPIKDKYDIHSKYKYSLVLENTITTDYWTEKLADCFLSESYPIYSGCTNISDYFDKSSFTAINIENYDESYNKIISILNSDLYNSSYESLILSKGRVANKYNLFNQIDSIISNKSDKIYQKEKKIIFPNLQGPRSLFIFIKDLLKYQL